MGAERRRSTAVWRAMAKLRLDTAHSHLSKPWHGTSGNGGWVNQLQKHCTCHIKGHRSFMSFNLEKKAGMQNIFSSNRYEGD